MKAIKLIGVILLRIILISLALVLFFSMMAGMYYKSSPRHIKMAVVDQDHSPLSRSMINSIRASSYFDIRGEAVDYNTLKALLNHNKIDVGVIIPPNAYRDIMNHRKVRVLAVLNGTANPIVPKLSMMMLGKIMMTLNMQMAMHVPVEDLGAIPNIRHPKTPLLSVSNRVFYNPKLSYEDSMLPAFMGLAMQIVSMLIVMFALMANLKKANLEASYIRQARQLPLKASIPPFIISWIIVAASISIAFFVTMYLFHVPFTEPVMWHVVLIISLLVLAMESISYFLVLNIKNGAVMAALITLIVMPAFMYSGYLIPVEQMAPVPNMIGNGFPLRHYLQALYLVFNHEQSLYSAHEQIHTLLLYSAGFLTLAALSIAIGQIERVHRRKKATKINQEKNLQEVKA
jgi:ABC-2 type transport system permease protein